MIVAHCGSVPSAGRRVGQRILGGVRLGIADHLGWAVAVMASSDYQVVDRGRITLIEPGMPAAPIEGCRLDLAATAALVARVEIVFSVVQKKVVTPNDFASTTELGQTLLASWIATTRPPGHSTGRSPPMTRPPADLALAA